MFTFGFRSEPCCIRVPIVNQKLFAIVNWFSIKSLWVSHGCGLCHSYGETLATINIVKDTKIYAARTYIQIFTANGFIKENKRMALVAGTFNF